MINALRGEFEAVVAGEPTAFDTRLGTIAMIEERCGGADIVEAVDKAVFGRRARDRIALLAAALAAMGRDPETATRLAEGASVGEAEAFLLALMKALGFVVAPRRGDGEARPLDGPGDGGSGGNSPSAA